MYRRDTQGNWIGMHHSFWIQSDVWLEDSIGIKIILLIWISPSFPLLFTGSVHKSSSGIEQFISKNRQGQLLGKLAVTIMAS